jgi:hypothetical protein
MISDATDNENLVVQRERGARYLHGIEGISGGLPCECVGQVDLRCDIAVVRGGRALATHEGVGGRVAGQGGGAGIISRRCRS